MGSSIDQALCCMLALWAGQTWNASIHRCRDRRFRRWYTAPSSAGSSDQKEALIFLQRDHRPSVPRRSSRSRCWPFLDFVLAIRMLWDQFGDEYSKRLPHRVSLPIFLLQGYLGRHGTVSQASPGYTAVAGGPELPSVWSRCARSQLTHLANRRHFDVPAHGSAEDTGWHRRCPGVRTSTVSRRNILPLGLQRITRIETISGTCMARVALAREVVGRLVLPRQHASHHRGSCSGIQARGGAGPLHRSPPAEVSTVGQRDVLSTSLAGHFTLYSQDLRQTRALALDQGGVTRHHPRPQAGAGDKLNQCGCSRSTPLL